MLKPYLTSLTETFSRGDAREESFYAALSDLLKDAAAEAGRPEVEVTTLPTQTEAGNPDFRVWDGRQRIVGYVEAKHPTTESLDAIEHSEQMARYRETFPNLILTNFFEFRLYRNGERIARVLAARPFVLSRLGQLPPVEDAEGLEQLLEQFFAFSLPKSYTAESLATELAKRTRFLREVVAHELTEEAERGRGALLGFFEAFKKYLIARLTLEDFADLYSQTITYGLFAARTRAGDDFSRRTAFQYVPRTIGILRDVFRFISLEDPPAQLQWIVDDIAEVLAAADAGGILDRFYREGKGADPIVHFYETFLAVYDPEERERRGVYYTPEPVVSYIVRSLDTLLKSEFEKADGLASDGVTLLDPAAGTMTFVARAAEEAVHTFERTYGAGGREQFIRDHVLRRFYAFELMMAPYAVGHLKMAFYLAELGHRLADDERFQLYLTNTLEMEDLEQTQIPGMASLAEESHLAGEVKKQVPILVILGNPPYSGHSANKGDWIRGLIDDYRQVDGKPLGERNPKWLQDDYVKFLRFAQWKIDQAGKGVIGMITNHSYLDNPTFRGMRRSLMHSFDEIRVLDLHGNSLKRETPPGGGTDQNVFDIRQGVAIAFFIKRGEDTGADARVFHAERWGTRKSKYEWLEGNHTASTNWEEISPRSEFYLFVPRDEVALERFSAYPSVQEIFPVNSVGIVTSRDGFVLDFDRESLMRRIRTFIDPKLPDEVIGESFGLRDKTGWKLSKVRRAVRADADWPEKVVRCLYRPFDERWLLYANPLIERTRRAVMGNMLTDENVALLWTRPMSPQFEFSVLCTSVVADQCVVGNKSAGAGISYLGPLYVSHHEHGDLFGSASSDERKPNLNPDVLARLTSEHGVEPFAEQVFHYVYAVLSAPSYRETYADFLKSDFPRIPFTADRELFAALAGLGERLVQLHLLRSPELDPPLARFQGEGDGRVAKNRRAGFFYEPAEERIWINPAQYFGPVPEEVWEYSIGGYQVLEKWLKDRRERTLSLDELRAYPRIVTALAKTIEVQEEIDALYGEVEGNVIAND